MLIEFTVKNYRSFHKECTFSLEAQNIVEEPKTNVVALDGYKIVKTAAIYGPNSSGKSNLISALENMKNCVINSVRLNDNETLPYDPFLLSDDSDKFEPTRYEILFLMDGTRYRYGFDYTLNSIVEEWLFAKVGSKKEKALFVRTEEGIGVSEKDFPEGVGNEPKTNDNRLFLSLCAQLGGEISKRVINWFSSGYRVISGLQSGDYRTFSRQMFHRKEEGYKEALTFFKTLQLGFEELRAKEENSNTIVMINGHRLPQKEVKLTTAHSKYNSKGEVVGEVIFDFENQESAGTQKLVELSGPIFETLLKGSVLVVDELDAKMHPLISEYIIKLFNDPRTNPLNAQLIFSTHDTHLLSARLLRRDQIWFTEKDPMEATDLYSMMDIILPDGSKPRNDTNYEKNYINGRYGAIPFIMND